MRSAGVGRPTDIYDLKVRVRMSQEMMDKTCRGFAEALAARDKAAARQVMDRHLSRYKVDEAALRINYPTDYFKQAQ